jgi:hypothetical protein
MGRGGGSVKSDRWRQQGNRVKAFPPRVMSGLARPPTTFCADPSKVVGDRARGKACLCDVHPIALVEAGAERRRLQSLKSTYRRSKRTSGGPSASALAGLDCRGDVPAVSLMNGRVPAPRPRLRNDGNGRESVVERVILRPPLPIRISPPASGRYLADDHTISALTPIGPATSARRLSSVHGVAPSSAATAT